MSVTHPSGPPPRSAQPVGLPAVVAGRRSEGGATSDLTFPTGQTIAVPRLDDRRATELKQLDREMLRDVPLDEILAFLHSVGRNWRSSEYARRRPFVRHLTHGLGCSEALVENEAGWSPARRRLRRRGGGGWGKAARLHYRALSPGDLLRAMPRSAGPRDLRSHVATALPRPGSRAC